MKKQINPTIKAHLIRGAFYLLLLVAVCAIPFALAQRNTIKRVNPASKSKMATKFAAAPPASGAAQGQCSLAFSLKPLRSLRLLHRLRMDRGFAPMTFDVFRGSRVSRQLPTVASLSDRGPLACFVA